VTEPDLDPTPELEPGEHPPAFGTVAGASSNGGEPPCRECDEWHERLISEARNLQLVAAGVLVGLLLVAAAIYSRKAGA
jgi:hypothetical protein